VPITADQITSLAPDTGALAAGQKSADVRLWSALGQSAEAIWGECRGSALYQVRVSLTDLASKCSCPSRKFPCKHALGLLLLAVREPGRVPASEHPDWVAEWLAGRSQAAARKQARRERAPGPPDAEARARRADRRVERVIAGIDGLELWMGDLARRGLAAAASRGDQAFQEQAARLVDAQAPGLASRVRRLGMLPRSAPDFGERAADALGRLALLAHAVRRLDQLTPALAADVRALVGWTVDREEVMASGERVTDAWAVVGQQTDEDERLRVQRTWLRGSTTARTALVLQFAAGEAPFAEAVPAGVVFEAELAFWPGAFPLRAVVSRRQGEVRSIRERLTGLLDLPGLLAAYGQALARQPWLDRIPAGCRDVVPTLEPGTTDRFALVDGGGRALPLAGRALWSLFALAGGHPVDVFGDWDGRVFMPFGVFAEGRLHALGAGTVDG
jgi:hypothetical protein